MDEELSYWLNRAQRYHELIDLTAKSVQSDEESKDFCECQLRNYYAPPGLEEEAEKQRRELIDWIAKHDEWIRDSRQALAEFTASLEEAESEAMRLMADEQQRVKAHARNPDAASESN